MKTLRILAICILVFTVRLAAADAPHVYWYEITLSTGNSTETIAASSDRDAEQLAALLTGEGFVAFQNVRGFGNRGDGLKWLPEHEGQKLFLRSTKILSFYTLPGDPARQ